MKVKDIRLVVDRMLRKERQGSTISPSDFNRFLRLASEGEFEVLKKAMEATNDIINDMKPFVAIEYVSHVSGIISQPSGYVKTLSLMDGNYVIDEVSQMEYREIKGSSILAPSQLDKVFYTVGTNIYVDPVPSSSTLKLVYIKNPTPPKLDYYINQQGNIVYLEANETVSSTLIDSDFLQYGRDGAPLPLTGGNYVSETVELEWPDNVHNRILLRVLALCGITVPDVLSINFATGYDKEKLD